MAWNFQNTGTPSMPAGPKNWGQYSPTAQAPLGYSTSGNYGANYNGQGPAWMKNWDGNVQSVQGSAGAQNVGLWGKMAHGYDPNTGGWHGQPAGANAGGGMPSSGSGSGMSQGQGMAGSPNGNMGLTSPSQGASFGGFNQGNLAAAKAAMQPKGYNYAGAFGSFYNPANEGSQSPGNAWAANWANNGGNEQGYQQLMKEYYSDPYIAQGGNPWGQESTAMSPAALQYLALNNYYGQQMGNAPSWFSNYMTPSAGVGANNPNQTPVAGPQPGQPTRG